jgi:hypothetical protein
MPIQGPGQRKEFGRGGRESGRWKDSSDSKRKSISDFSGIIRNLAQTSHYEVQFSIPDGELRSYMDKKNISDEFITKDLGLLCYEANLPGTSVATFEIFGHRTGMVEKFAHARNDYGNTIGMGFYVDKNYKSLLFFETWLEFISSGSYSAGDLSFINEQNYFTRIKYPEKYKSNKTTIYKFDRDYKRQISYTFEGLFPEAIQPISVSYNQSEILKFFVTLSYDRYIPGRTDSVDIIERISNNLGDLGTRLF